MTQDITELPWQQKSSYDLLTIIGNVDGEYFEGQLHSTYKTICDVETNTKDAAFIVLACNNHKRLTSELEQARAALAKLAYVSKHLACLYRPETTPETPEINDAGIDQMFHCCDWNEIYEICRVAEGLDIPREASTDKEHFEFSKVMG